MSSIIEKMSLSERLTYSTVLIKCKFSNGTLGTGTGFVIDLCPDKVSNTCIPVIITNNHVVAGATEIEFGFCKADDTGIPLDKEQIWLRCDLALWRHHPDSTVDLQCYPLAGWLKELTANNARVFYIPLNTELIPSEKVISELSAMEDVVMIGYPRGISDEFNYKPVIRKGITATHPRNDYQGSKEILLDIPAYPGSSGSPVFILNQGSFATSDGIALGNRILLLGILYAGPMFTATGNLLFANLPVIPTPVTQIPMNLGVIIKSERILEFEKLFK